MDRELLIFVAACCQLVPAIFVWQWFNENASSFQDGALVNLIVAHAAFLNFVIGILLGLAIRRYPQGYEMIATIAGFSAAAILVLAFGKFLTSRSLIALGGVFLAIVELTALIFAGRG